MDFPALIWDRYFMIYKYSWALGIDFPFLSWRSSFFFHQRIYVVSIFIIFSIMF
ncbi:Uncharacterised protein [Trueperella pyogenes]|nr:Uncharacterised protein [Trueperella pyogenes]